MRKHLVTALVAITFGLVGSLAGQTQLFGPAVPNNTYFSGLGTDARVRPLVGLDSSNLVSIDPDAGGASFGGAVTITGEMVQNARIDLSGVTPAVADTDGGTFKIGDTTTPVASTAADMSMARMIFDLDHSGAYGLYVRGYANTAASSVDASRMYGTVNDVAAATVRGSHTSLSFGTTGSITGLGVAEELTLHIPSGGKPGGTIAAVKAAINSDGTTDPDTSALSFLQAVNQGNATGMNNVDDVAALIAISGSDIGADNMIEAGGSAPDLNDLTHAIRITIDGTAYYLVLSDQNPDTW